MNRVRVYKIRSSCDGSVAAAITKIPMWNAFRGLMLSCARHHTTQCPLLSLRLCRYSCACLPACIVLCMLCMGLNGAALKRPALPVAERAAQSQLVTSKQKWAMRSKTVKENVALASAFCSWSSRKGKQLNHASRFKLLALATANKP